MKHGAWAVQVPKIVVLAGKGGDGEESSNLETPARIMREILEFGQGGLSGG